MIIYYWGWSYCRIASVTSTGMVDWWMWSDEIVVDGGGGTYAGTDQFSLTSNVDDMCAGVVQISLVRWFESWWTSQCSRAVILRSLSVIGLGFFALNFSVLVLFHLFVPDMKNTLYTSLLRYRCDRFSRSLMDLLLSCVLFCPETSLSLRIACALAASFILTLTLNDNFISFTRILQASLLLTITLSSCHEYLNEMSISRSPSDCWVSST